MFWCLENMLHIWNDELDELFNLSSHRFWLLMVSALDLGCSNHNPTQATTGNLIATFCQFHFGQKVGYFKKLFKDSTFSVTGLLWEVAIGLPEVAWVGLWLEQPRSSAETIKSQTLWLESSKSSSYVLMFRKYATYMKWWTWWTF